MLWRWRVSRQDLRDSGGARDEESWQHQTVRWRRGSRSSVRLDREPAFYERELSALRKSWLACWDSNFA